MSETVKRPRGTGSLKLRGNTWWIVYSHRGRRYDESSESSDVNIAKKLLAKRLGQIASGTFAGLNSEKVTISELADLVLQDYEHNKRRSTPMVRYRVNLHVKPLLGEVKAAQFSQAHAKKYVCTRRQQEASDATINRELAIVRRGFTLALQQDPPLVARTPHIPKLEEDNVRQGFVEHAQYIALREKLPTHLKCLLVVGFHVGCRLGELRKIRWDQVDLDGREIRLTQAQTKAKTARTLPIYGDMLEWLKAQKETRDEDWPTCPWVFNYLGRPIGSHLKGWRRSCKEADLEGLLFHDLRRSAVRNMERAGIPRKIAMAISGHKTEAVYRRYDIVSAADLKLAAAKMETYFQEVQPRPAQPSEPKSDQMQ